MLSAPQLSFLKESSVSNDEEHEDEDEENNTDSESESGKEKDVSYSEAVQYDDHLEWYGAHYICLKIDSQSIYLITSSPISPNQEINFFEGVCLHCLTV